MKEAIELLIKWLKGTYIVIDVRVPIAAEYYVPVISKSKRIRVSITLPMGYEIEPALIDAIYEDVARKALRN